MAYYDNHKSSESIARNMIQGDGVAMHHSESIQENLLIIQNLSQRRVLYSWSRRTF